MLSISRSVIIVLGVSQQLYCSLSASSANQLLADQQSCCLDLTLLLVVTFHYIDFV